MLVSSGQEETWDGYIGASELVASPQGGGGAGGDGGEGNVPGESPHQGIHSVHTTLYNHICIVITRVYSTHPTCI